MTNGNVGCFGPGLNDILLKFTDMKVRLYAGDMHLNRKDQKCM